MASIHPDSHVKEPLLFGSTRDFIGDIIRGPILLTGNTTGDPGSSQFILLDPGDESNLVAVNACC